MALTDNLVSYYELEESSGTTATDSHGTNDGTYSGNLPTAVTGKIGNAQDGDGSNSDLITVSDTNDLDLSGDFTIAYWVNFDATGLSEGVLAKGNLNDGGAAGYSLYKPTNDFMRLILRDGTNQDLIEGSTTNISSGTWYHFVATRSGSDVTLYLNGSSDGTGTSSLDPSNTDDLTMFNDIDGSFSFDGQLDEVGIWTRALTAQEVSDLYNNGNGLAYPFSTGRRRAGFNTFF